MSAGHRMEAALEGVPFRVVDKNKRSRFQLCDLTKLMLIVTRRESFATPHGKGDEEACQDKVAALIKKHKQESAASRWASGVTEELTELSNLIEAYWQLKSQFEEKKQAASDEAKRKQKRLATAGGKAISKAALRQVLVTIIVKTAAVLVAKGSVVSTTISIINTNTITTVTTYTDITATVSNTVGSDIAIIYIDTIITNWRRSWRCSCCYGTMPPTCASCPMYNVIAQMRLATAPKGQLRPAAWVRRAGSTRSYVPCLRRRAARRPS
ncbi:hypothetical protein F444_04334 [Phytophthora nicotianae P1976]|uniref:Uncharacterized protein n=1 Tax=Phytophthora nicotianae P1976 TaxID=1317066 RepID=A0A081AQZ5_PHYNI|nr:hypothetical protein F444_04334 [Phytophthora nicotianae P1976]